MTFSFKAFPLSCGGRLNMIAAIKIVLLNIFQTCWEGLMNFVVALPNCAIYAFGIHPFGLRILLLQHSLVLADLPKIEGKKLYCIRQGKLP